MELLSFQGVWSMELLPFQGVLTATDDTPSL